MTPQKYFNVHLVIGGDNYELYQGNVDENKLRYGYILFTNLSSVEVCEDKLVICTGVESKRIEKDYIHWMRVTETRDEYPEGWANFKTITKCSWFWGKERTYYELSRESYKLMYDDLDWDQHIIGYKSITIFNGDYNGN